MDAASLQKLRSFQEAVLFTLWKVTVRLQVVDGFVRATASLPKLVSVATTLKQLKALLASIPDSVAPEVVAAHDTTVRAVRERALSRTKSTPLATAARPVSPDNAADSRDRSPTIGAADLPAILASSASASSSAASSPLVGRSPATPLRQRHGTLSAIVPPTFDAADNQAAGGTDERNVLLVSIDASCAELDRRLEACGAPPPAASGESVLRTHTMLCSSRAVVAGHAYPYTDLPVKERARFAANVRDAARVGKIAMLAQLNEFSTNELRAHLRRARERLGATPTLLAMISFACMLRDIALCVADAEQANGGDALLAGAELRRAHEAQSAFHASTPGRLLESAARLNREVADEALMSSELAHFGELEAAVIDANAREQVLELVIRTLKAKTRALTREQYDGAGGGGGVRSSGGDDDEDVDINVLELELLELTVQLDARAAVSGSNNDGDEVVDAHSAATKLCGELVQALCAQGPHYVAELSRHLRTPAARDDMARFVTATLYPDVLMSRVDFVLLRVIGATVHREAADAGRCDAVLPIDGSSFARSLLLRYGRRRSLRAFASQVLRDVLVELCRDPPLDPEAEASSTASSKLPSESIARLQKYCRDIFERVARLVEQTPVGVRWVARELLTAMQQHYPQDCARSAAGEAAVLRFVFGTLLGQAVLYPDLYSVFRMDEMPPTRHNLTLLSRALIAVGCGVAPAGGALAPLGSFVTQVRPALSRYCTALAAIGDLASHLDFPQRPPLSDAGATLVRAPLCHVLRPTELLKWSCLLDSTRTRMLAPSPSATTDALVARTLRAIDMLSASDKRSPVPAEAPIDDTPTSAADVPQSNIASIERMLATFADQIRDTSPLVTSGDVKKTYGSLSQFVDGVLAPRCAVAASQLATALRSCALKDDALLHRLDAAFRMRQLGRRLFFIDKCELTQALREHRVEVTALAMEKHSYVQFVQQLSTEWTGDLDVSLGHAAPESGASSTGALDYFDAETFFAYENSVACGDEMEAWQF
jgi:hypothetical protein